MLVLVPDGTVCIFCASISLFLGQGQCLKAEECALLCWEMKWHRLCFMLCIRYTVLGHLSHRMWIKVCAFDSLDIDMNQNFIFKMRSLLFSLHNLLKGDKMITYYCRITKIKTKESNLSVDKILFAEWRTSILEI